MISKDSLIKIVLQFIISELVAYLFELTKICFRIDLKNCPNDKCNFFSAFPS